MKVVLSGVNLVEGGPLKVFKDAILAFSENKSFEIICLVNQISLFEDIVTDNIKFQEFPRAKKSWLNRIIFEYWSCKKISKMHKADIWLSMHDITPNIDCGKQFVYCHNPAPFYKATLNDFKHDVKFSLFTLFYKWLYKINITKNTAVITQQQWLADYFINDLKARSAIVAKPNGVNSKNSGVSAFIHQDKIKFFYPALARTFKNFELLLNTFEFLSKEDKEIYNKIELILTINGENSDYEASLYNKYSHLTQVKFVGRLTPSEVNSYYKDSDIVVFPSKLETWGLPISEAKSFNKPILLADLPYAHETLGSYHQVKFIDIDNYKSLAKVIREIVNGDNVFQEVVFTDKDDVCHSWGSLVAKMVELTK